MQCGFCVGPIADDQPKTELMCRHLFHTRCVLENFVGHGLYNSRCVTCLESVLPADMITEDDDFTADDDALNHDRIKRLVEAVPAFTNEIRGFKALYSDYTLKRTIASRAIKGLHEAYMTEMKPVYEMIRDKHAAKLKEMKEHADFIALKRASLSYCAKLRAFKRKWQVTLNQLHRFQWRNPEMRLKIPYPECTVSYDRVIRKFKRRLRVRW